MKYILVEWPDVQYLMDKEGFKENSSLADGEKFGSSAYFVSEEWYDENYEEEEYSFIVETTVEVPIEIEISITGTNYGKALSKLKSYSLDQLLYEGDDLNFKTLQIKEIPGREIIITDCKK